MSIGRNFTKLNQPFLNSAATVTSQRTFSTTNAPIHRTQSTLASPISQLFSTLTDPPKFRNNDVGRPQTAWERVKNFPDGVKGLCRDALQYKHIHDASRTKLNAWSINHPYKRGTAVHGYFLDEDGARPGRIPRRQFELQRQFKNDFAVMFPLVLVWIPPIIGFLPPILAVFFPRQFMSHHFHNLWELESYAQLQYEQQRDVFVELGNLFWNSFPTFTPSTPCVLFNATGDAAGPALDGATLYSLFGGYGAKGMTSRYFHLGMYSSMEGLPREYLVKLSLAVGVGQHLPGWLSPWVAEFLPSFFLKGQIRRIGDVVCHDDCLLLEEGHNTNHCVNLTDVEVMKACLMRGLPVTSNSKAKRRQLLTNHLIYVARVKQHMHGPVTDGFRLFTLHLAPLRYHAQQALAGVD